VHQKKRTAVGTKRIRVGRTGQRAGFKIRGSLSEGWKTEGGKESSKLGLKVGKQRGQGARGPNSEKGEGGKSIFSGGEVENRASHKL